MHNYVSLVKTDPLTRVICSLLFFYLFTLRFNRNLFIAIVYSVGPPVRGSSGRVKSF